MVFPDETALLPIFRKRIVREQPLVFVNGIHIKEEDTARIQIVVDQPKHLREFFRAAEIIHRIAAAYDGAAGAVELKFPHILTEVKRIAAVRYLFLKGLFQHFLGIVNAYHVKASRCEPFRAVSRAATEFRDNPVCNAEGREESHRLLAPGVIGNAVHKKIVEFCKTLVSRHSARLLFLPNMKNAPLSSVRRAEQTYAFLPQQYLYFLPEPQGQGSFLPTLTSLRIVPLCFCSRYSSFLLSALRM